MKILLLQINLIRTIWGRISSFLSLALITCLILLPVFTLQAQIAIPDAVRPGAIRPEQTGRQIIPTEPPTPEQIFEQPDAVLEVPPVIDRPFEIDEGPKVAVREFRLLNAVDLPQFGISLNELAALLQEQIGARPEGFTVGQLQEVADQVTIYYREHGLILAQAVVPVQTVDAGVVTLQVFEGKLGRVVVEGNEKYKESILITPFAKLIGQPVTQASIESAILQLTDFPGLSVFGVFQPGQQVGTADIVLRVQGEDLFEFAYRVDNHGLLETGKYRFRPTFEWNNPTGAADRISLGIQQTYEPKNNTFTSADYDRYLGWGLRAGLSWNRNIFDVGGELEAQQIVGETRLHSLFLDKAWLRSRRMNFSSRLGYFFKESTTKTRGRQTNNDRLSVFTVSGIFDNVDIRFRGINVAAVELSQGINDFFGAMGSSEDALELEIRDRSSRQGGLVRRFAAGEFTKIFASASRYQTINSSNGLFLLVRGEYQWSSNLLVPLEQYSIGGPDNVRAYPQAQQLVDRAAFYSVELIKNMPFIGDKVALGNRTWGELVQLSVFYDFAVGRLNAPLVADTQEGLGGYVNFSGAGVQLRFTLPGLIESRFIFASNLTDTEPDNGRNNQIWADITYRF